MDVVIKVELQKLMQVTCYNMPIRFGGTCATDQHLDGDRELLHNHVQVVKKSTHNSFIRNAFMQK